MRRKNPSAHKHNSFFLAFSRIRNTDLKFKKDAKAKNFDITSVADPDPPVPRVFGPPGSKSRSTSQRY